MPRAPLLSQGEPKVHHEGYAGQGDEQAEASEDALIPLGPLGKSLDVLALRLPHLQACAAGLAQEGFPHSRCQIVGLVQRRLPFAGNSQPDDVDALVSGQRAQVGQRRKKRRPEGIRARPLRPGDACHAELHDLLRTDDDAEPVADLSLQPAGQRG